MHRVAVFESGRIKEYDTPDNLLADRKSVFFSMAVDAGLTA